jgi:DNA-binding MarR family transcriptional regulator
MENPAAVDGDFIDGVIAEWGRELPELDTRGLSVGGRILVLNKHIEKRIDRHLERFGVQIWGFDVLASLRRSGPPYTQTPKQLMHTCFLTSGAVTNRVNRLEAAGLVVRANDTEDRRSVKVALTPQGHELVDEALVDRIEHMKEIFSVLSSRERETLAGLLRKLMLRFEHLEQ